MTDKKAEQAQKTAVNKQSLSRHTDPSDKSELLWWPQICQSKKRSRATELIQFSKTFWMQLPPTKAAHLLTCNCGVALSPAVVLNQFFPVKFSWWSSFPPESSFVELQLRFILTDSTSVWRLLLSEFQQGSGRRRKDVCHTLFHPLNKIK